MNRSTKVGLITVSLAGERVDLAEKFSTAAKRTLQDIGVDVIERQKVCIKQNEISDSTRYLIENQTDCILYLIGTWIYAPSVVSVLQSVAAPAIIWGIPEGASFSSVGANVLHGSLDELGIHHKLVYGLPEDPQTALTIKKYALASKVKRLINRSRFGLVGGRSLGMYTATVDPIQVKNIFGIEIEHIDQSLLVEYAKRIEDNLAQSYFNKMKEEYGQISVPDNVMIKSIKLYYALKEIIIENNLDFIGVKCLEEVINIYTSCCLAVSMLNNEGIITACQSDVNAAILMKAINILSNQPTIFADLNCIDKQTKIARLINCGSMPTSLSKNPKDVDWGFQYEYMGKARGACPVFCCKGGQVTICAMSRIKGKYWMQIAQGEAFEQPKSRFSEVRDIWPQAFIKMNCDVDDYYQNLRSNHIVTGYGDFVDELIDYCQIANIDYIVN
jgi:L-fucose isomerase